MPTLLRNILALVLGLVIGGSVNMALVSFGPLLIPPPPGADMTTPEGLGRAMPFLMPRHFIAPFLAHALGTFAGALAAYGIAASHRPRFAYAVGLVFLCGGIAACVMLPAPAWFIALDLLLAYLPMAWLAVFIGGLRCPDAGRGLPSP